MSAACALMLIATLVGAPDSVPAEVRAAFATGRQLVETGRDGRDAFRQALRHLLDREAEHGGTPEYYLNVGRAAYLADDLPRSIWAFHHGLALAPQDARLYNDLEFARGVVHRGHAAYRPLPERWPSWLPRWSAAVWARVGVVAYLTAWLLVAVAWVRRDALPRRQGWWLGFGALAAAIVALAGYAWFTGYSSRQRDRAAPVVVIREERSALATGNSPRYPRHAELPIVHAGMEARILGERGGWLHIEFASGQVGWIDAEAALVVRPAE